MLITRKEFILTDPEAGFKRLVYLLYYTMEHDLLYSCLRSLHNLFVYKVPSKSTESLLQLISSLYRKPRSLKQSCRVRIYECLDKKLAQNLSRLKLPGPLKEYMLNFE